MIYNPACPAVERFENIEPFGKWGAHACMLRDENELRYVVFADKNKVWPVYAYIFKDAQWHGITEAHMPMVLDILHHCMPCPAVDIKWRTPINMARLAQGGTTGLVYHMMSEAAGRRTGP